MALKGDLLQNADVFQVLKSYQKKIEEKIKECIERFGRKIP